jgi:hypothetical protein
MPLVLYWHVAFVKLPTGVLRQSSFPIQFPELVPLVPLQIRIYHEPPCGSDAFPVNVTFAL